MKPTDDDLAVEAANIALMLAGAENLMHERPKTNETPFQASYMNSVFAIVGGARQLLERLADKIEGTGA